MITTRAELLEATCDILTAPQMPLSVARDVASGFVDRYEFEPWRHQHNVPHLGRMAWFLLDHIDELENPRVVFWETFGHDVIDIPQLSLPGVPPGLNEELSAQFTVHRLAPFLPYLELPRIGKGIRGTATHEWDGIDKDVRYLFDADMCILGASPAEFDEYDENIRREYSFVPLDVFRSVRKGILQNFLDRDQLFFTEAGQTLFDQQARENLARKITEYEAAEN